MDVLSLSASIITVVGASNTVLRTIYLLRDLKGAENDVHALANEVTDLKAFCNQVKVALQDWKDTPPAVRKYVSLIIAICYRLTSLPG